MAIAQAGLWAENVEAWRLFHILATRCVRDLRIGPAVWSQMTADLTLSEMEDLMTRLTIINDVLLPAPTHA